VGQLVSGPRLVDRIWPGVRVSASSWQFLVSINSQNYSVWMESWWWLTVSLCHTISVTLSHF